MRIIQFVIIILFTQILFASDKELNFLDKLGGILESQATHISITITVFGLIISVFLALAYSRSQSIISKIENNKDKIDVIKENMDENLKEFRKELNAIKFHMDEDLKEFRKEMKDEIKEEITQQIVYTADEAVQKVQEHAYRKVDYNINKLTEEIQNQRFAYQKIIFKINQGKKYEYEGVLNNKKLETEEKIEKIITIQGQYNEINNQSIPKLFSRRIEADVIPTAEKLSEYKKIKHIIIEVLEKLLKRDDYSFVDKENIKDVLISYYHWEEK